MESKKCMEVGPMDRRAFTAMLGGLGLGSLRALGAGREGDVTGGGSGGSDDPEVLRLSRNGWMPNNEHLPVLLYRGVMHGEGDAAAAQFERISERNGWPAQWTNGVYDFHHYHSTAHGQTWDICRQAPDKEAIARMATLPFPASDPVKGASGPLPRLWRS
jgi:hypothetical protein